MSILQKQQQDESKLPKWAQIELNRLRRDVENYRAQIEQMDTNAQSNVTWSTGLDDEHTLPTNARITFHTENGRIMAYLYKDQLEINGSYAVVVSPKASNAFVIKIVR